MSDFEALDLDFMVAPQFIHRLIVSTNLLNKRVFILGQALIVRKQLTVLQLQLLDVMVEDLILQLGLRDTHSLGGVHAHICP